MRPRRSNMKATEPASPMRRRALAAGSGTPPRAAMVMSRENLENSLERAASWRSLRNWMFLNLEWPAMERASSAGRAVAPVVAALRPLRHAIEETIARHLPRKRTGEERKRIGFFSFLPCEAGEVARGSCLPRDGGGVRLRPILLRYGGDFVGGELGEAPGDQGCLETAAVGDLQVQIDGRTDARAAPDDRHQVNAGVLKLRGSAAQGHLVDVVQIDPQIEHVGAGRTPALPLIGKEAGTRIGGR